MPKHFEKLGLIPTEQALQAASNLNSNRKMPGVKLDETEPNSPLRLHLDGDNGDIAAGETVVGKDEESFSAMAKQVVQLSGQVGDGSGKKSDREILDEDATDSENKLASVNRDEKVKSPTAVFNAGLLSDY